MDQALDAALWQRARQDVYTIVTKDSDFADLSVLRGFPPKVIWIRIGNCTTAQVETLLRANHAAVVAFDQDQVLGLLSRY